jgi:hypothetical protein
MAYSVQDRPKNRETTEEQSKSMLIIFFDNKRVHNKEFILVG